MRKVRKSVSFSVLDYDIFPILISLSSSFFSLNYTDLSIKSPRERLIGIVHIHCKQKIMGGKNHRMYISDLKSLHNL